MQSHLAVRQGSFARGELSIELIASRGFIERWDVSVQGLFVPSDDLPPVGALLELHLKVSSVDEALPVRARVSDVRAPGEGPTPGFRLEFLSPSAELTDALSGFLARAPSQDAEAYRRTTPRFPVGTGARLHLVPARAPVEPPPERLVLRYESDEQLALDYVENLSYGGAFVRTEGVLPLGSSVELTMELPDGRQLTVPGMVVHVRPEGVGIQFEPDVQRRAQLAQLVGALALPRRALVVDDDALMRAMLSDALAAQGFEVLTAANGDEALRILLDELFTLDVLVADLHMPNLRGEQLAALVRRTGGEHDMPILLMSGSLPEGLRAQFREEEVDAFLDKAEGPAAIALTAARAVCRRRLVRAAPPA